MRKLGYLCAILLILISITSCAPRLITPRIDYQSYAELKPMQPSCGGELSALTNAEHKSNNLILDTIFCYRSIWKYWEGEYQILDAQIQNIYK